MGRRRFDSGELLVFGEVPGSGSGGGGSGGIPGRGVGFMPQELALYGEFSFRETADYFGRLYRLDAELVRRETDFLVRLLDLPPADRPVKTLSGGQQRRVSFAVAIFHRPQLLILDEPTAGVDPILRSNIWKFLERLSSEQGTTILITTHYIEEALGAHTVRTTASPPRSIFH